MDKVVIVTLKKLFDMRMFPHNRLSLEKHDVRYWLCFNNLFKLRLFLLFYKYLYKFISRNQHTLNDHRTGF